MKIKSIPNLLCLIILMRHSSVLGLVKFWEMVKCYWIGMIFDIIQNVIFVVVFVNINIIVIDL
jgi:hypothetical protein